MTVKILLADDSLTIQKIVRLAFSAEDAVVETVSDGDAALNAIKAFTPDIVLADVHMPGCNGYEICERIKEDPHLGPIPVILLVGAFETFDEAEAARVRCDKHLTKPFDTEELIRTVYSLAEKPATLPNSGIHEAQTTEADKSKDSGDGFGAPTVAPSDPVNRPSSVESRIWDSFLGSARVLEMFDADVLASIQGGSAAKNRPWDINASSVMRGAGTPAPEGEQFSGAFLDKIVDRVVQRMSSEVIREVAWEVVPELSEDIIRQTIKQTDKS